MPPPCRNCGSRDRYFSQGQRDSCHLGAPMHPGACRSCLAWGVHRAHSWYCWSCCWWATPYPTGRMHGVRLPHDDRRCRNVPPVQRGRTPREGTRPGGRPRSGQPPRPTALPGQRAPHLLAAWQTTPLARRPTPGWPGRYGECSREVGAGSSRDTVPVEEEGAAPAWCGSSSAWLGGQPEESDAAPDLRLRREAGGIGQIAVRLADHTRSARRDRHPTLRSRFDDNSA